MALNLQDPSHRIDRLQDAFYLFNRLSADLSDSYQDLENRVVHLSEELALARDARINTLSEKEKLANRLQTLVDTLPGGVVVVEDDGKITEYTKIAASLLGAPLDGRFWPEVLDTELTVEAENPQEATVNSSGMIVNLSISKLKEEQGRIIFITDVSEIRKLQDMVERQKRLSALGNMVAGLAHQIRTPLSTAMLYASHLRDDELTGAQRKKFSHKLYERLQSLEAQVNDMLIFAKDGNLITEVVSLDQMITVLNETMESYLVNSSVTLGVQRKTRIECFQANSKALSGALSNLLSNSFEALQGQGRVTLDILESENESLQFIVTDNGPGIVEPLRKKIFEPFFTTRSNGTGLGLAVVERVALAHGGSIRCDFPRTGGSQFTFTLPIVPNEALLPSGYSQLCQSRGIE